MVENSVEHRKANSSSGGGSDGFYRGGNISPGRSEWGSAFHSVVIAWSEVQRCEGFWHC